MSSKPIISNIIAVEALVEVVEAISPPAKMPLPRIDRSIHSNLAGRGGGGIFTIIF
jgi:hypothetical protein